MATKKINTEETVEETTVEEVKTVKKTVKKHEPTDMIPCRSMTSGKLFVEGNRTKFLYTWADYNDVVEVEFQDLDFMVRSNNVNVYEPRFIIEDDEIVADNKKLSALYDSMYSVQDLRDILDMNATQMKRTIESLPVGCQNTLKGIAATMIDNGQLDSVTKIKVLDEIFGTDLLLSLVQD